MSNRPTARPRGTPESADKSRGRPWGFWVKQGTAFCSNAKGALGLVDLRMDLSTAIVAFLAVPVRGIVMVMSGPAPGDALALGLWAVPPAAAHLATRRAAAGGRAR